VRALPLILSALAGLLITGPALRFLAAEGDTRENHRGRVLPFPAGFAIVAAAVVALVPLAALRQLSDVDLFEPELGRIAVYALGVAFLGLVDDALAGAARGWRGHGAAVLGGTFSTGALKAFGALGLAMFVLRGSGRGDGEYLLAVALLVLATNLFNLLDLRPGRAAKALALVGIGVSLGAWSVRPLWALGLFLGPALVAGYHDLRERAMLGDTGSNLLGGLAGLWLVLALGTVAQAVALAAVLAVTVYGEFRSVSAWIERTPGIRQLDSIGRPS
jgi:UDP-N-acetylmuramyl pentapeptide phosphotransferase/UDP-N-acetylglucosamine-1-phosphate transferase